MYFVSSLLDVRAFGTCHVLYCHVAYEVSAKGHKHAPLVDQSQVLNV